MAFDKHEHFREFARVYNDVTNYPDLTAVASALGIAHKTVKNKAALIRSRRLTDSTIPELISRRAHAAFPRPAGIEHRDIDTCPDDPEEPIEELLGRAMDHSDRVIANVGDTSIIDVKIQEPGPFGVVGIPDNHMENPGTALRRMFDDAYYIRQHPNLFAICVGDFVDNFIIGRLERESRKNKMSRKDAWRIQEHYIELLAPKLVGLVGGNHDKWTSMTGGYDVLQRMLEEQGLGRLYHSDQLRVRLRTPSNRNFMHLVRHKFRGNSQYNSLHGITKWILERWQGETAVWGGHIHQAGHVSIQKDWMGQSHSVHAIQLGTYKIVDDYAVTEGFRPNQPFMTPMLVHVPETGESIFFDDIHRGAEYLDWLRNSFGYN